MAPTFSNPSKIVTATATVDSDQFVTEWAVKDALTRTARNEGVTVRDLTVSIADGPRTVTMTEDEYNTLVTGGTASESSE
jgi:hypothetical protein